MKIESQKEGAELVSIIYNGEEKLHDGKNFWNRHSPILFPIVGKLRNNITNINGEIYKMNQHGFARDMEFKIVEYKDSKQSYLLESSQETKLKYPFDFSLYVTYYIDNETLITEYKVINTGEEIMPFGIGGHPAYKLNYANSYIEFEQDENVIKYQLEDGLISKEENIKLSKNFYLDQDSFNQDAIILKGLKSSKLFVRNKETKKIELEFTCKEFPYLAFWSKKNAPFLCIEPWYAVADRKDFNGDFKEKEGNIFLGPKKEFMCSYSVKFM